MARPQKPLGLEYFYLEVNFFKNKKIELISEKFGEIAELIILKILVKIYEEKGYYCEWDEDSIRLFAKYSKEYNYKQINDITIESLIRNFFSFRLYEEYKILTNQYIQEHYLHATKQRNKIILEKKFLCLPKYILEFIEKEKYFEVLNRKIEII